MVPSVGGGAGPRSRNGRALGSPPGRGPGAAGVPAAALLAAGPRGVAASGWMAPDHAGPEPRPFRRPLRRRLVPRHRTPAGDRRARRRRGCTRRRREGPGTSRRLPHPGEKAAGTSPHRGDGSRGGWGRTRAAGLPQRRPPAQGARVASSGAASAAATHPAHRSGIPLPRGPAARRRGPPGAPAPRRMPAAPARARYSIHPISRAVASPTRNSSSDPGSRPRPGPSGTSPTIHSAWIWG